MMDVCIQLHPSRVIASLIDSPSIWALLRQKREDDKARCTERAAETITASDSNGELPERVFRNLESPNCGEHPRKEDQLGRILGEKIAQSLTLGASVRNGKTEFRKFFRLAAMKPLIIRLNVCQCRVESQKKASSTKLIK